MCDLLANDTTRSASQYWTYSKPNTTSRNRFKPHGWRTGKCWKNEINCWRFLIATKKKKKESDNNYYCNKRSKNGKIEKLIEWEFHFLTCDGKNDMVNWHNRHNCHQIVHLRRLHKVFAQCWRARQPNEIWNLKYSNSFTLIASFFVTSSTCPLFFVVVKNGSYF